MVLRKILDTAALVLYCVGINKVTLF